MLTNAKKLAVPKSPEVKEELLNEARFYHLTGLVKILEDDNPISGSVVNSSIPSISENVAKTIPEESHQGDMDKSLVLIL
jgi:folate-binding Fe-S cluster repair protein YgfZ